MFVEENFASIYLQGMRDRSMRSGTKFAREIQLTDWSTAGNLSNRSSGEQIPRDICTRFGRYLYSTRCSWIINNNYSMSPRWIWSDKITNERVARVGYNHFISKGGEWNNCFSKFSNRVLPPFFISTILQSENF